jgi:mitogen-activated protein kinase 1/3
MDFVTDAKAIEYLKSFPSKKRINLEDIYPGSTKESIDFLNKTIVFNPAKRLTIEEALKHPLFDKVRDVKKEISADNSAILNFEKEGELTLDRLRELFVEEIRLYHKK